MTHIRSLPGAEILFDGTSERIILDCDGVLLRWWAGFGDWLRQNHAIETDPRGPSTFCMTDWTGITDRARMLNLIGQFNATPDSGFGRLQPVAGAAEALSSLRDAGLKLYVLTSCSDDPAVRRARMENLEAVFGPVFEDVTCIGLEHSKEPFLRAHPPSVFIDDHPRHVRIGRDAGHHAMLMSDSHNLHEHATCGGESIPVLRGWSEVIEAQAGPGPLLLAI